MLNISRLLRDIDDMTDSLRYSEESQNSLTGTGKNKGPVVVWNVTRACNLNCRHCYAGEKSTPHPRELSTREARKLISDLGYMNVPVLLFSGGEPLLREDIEELIAFAREQGMMVALSSNGTLIDLKTARQLKKLGVSYVGISLDGDSITHNRFRGHNKAYQKTLAGIKNCQKAGQKVGLRFTMVEQNREEIDSIFQLMQEEDIPRLCLYHLVPQGKGSSLQKELMTDNVQRQLIDDIITRAKKLQSSDQNKEILTVANQTDGVFLYLRLKKEGDSRAEKVYKYLQRSGGNRSGQAIACIDWQGEVHPDQFSFAHSVGNIREKSFADIWKNSPPRLLRKLRSRREYITGRCSECKWFEICNGNMRTRAEFLAGDYWASDPGCYLTDSEISAI